MLLRFGNMDVREDRNVKFNFFQDERLKLVGNVKKLRPVGEGSYFMRVKIGVGPTPPLDTRPGGHSTAPRASDLS
jgi:hypothetical protein